jgi:hypothetical protein
MGASDRNNHAYGISCLTRPIPTAGTRADYFETGPAWAVSRRSEQLERHREDDGLGQKSGLILRRSIADLNCFNLRGEQSDSPTSTDGIYAPGNWVSRAAVQAGFGGHIRGHTME